MDFLVMDLDHSSHHSCREHVLFSVEIGLYKRTIPRYGQSPVPPPGCITPTHLHDGFNLQYPSFLTVAEEWT